MPSPPLEYTFFLFVWRVRGRQEDNTAKKKKLKKKKRAVVQTCDDENPSSPSGSAAFASIPWRSAELGPAPALWEDGFGVLNTPNWCFCLADLALLWKMFYAKQPLLCFGKQLRQKS